MGILVGVLAGVLAGVLVDVLVDLRVGFFFMTGLLTLSSGKGSTMGGPKLRVRSRDRSASRGTLGEVVVFLWHLRVGLVIVWGLVGTVLLNLKISSSSSLSLASSTTNSLPTCSTSNSLDFPTDSALTPPNLDSTTTESYTIISYPMIKCTEGITLECKPTNCKSKLFKNSKIE